MWILSTQQKSFSIFPSPAGMSPTKLSLGGNNDVIYKLFPPRESLESEIPAGDGNIEKLFLLCNPLLEWISMARCKDGQPADLSQGQWDLTQISDYSLGAFN